MAAPPQVCICAMGPKRNISPTSRTPKSSPSPPQKPLICREFVKLGERRTVLYAEPPSRA